MQQLNPGYRGYLSYGGSLIRLTSGEVSVTQNVLSNPTVFGLRDNRNGSNIVSGKFDSQPTAYQKTLYRPSVKSIDASFSFPVTEETPLERIFMDAAEGNNFSVIDYFDCDQGTEILGCKMSSFSLSCSQGGFVECSISISGLDIGNAGSTPKYSRSERICQWTNVAFDAIGINAECAESISLTIENQIIPIYTSGNNQQNNLLPMKLRIGEQNISGSIVFYSSTPSRGWDINNAFAGNTPETLEIAVAPVLSIKRIPVRFHPVKSSNNISVPLGTMAFTGVDFLVSNF